MSRKIHIISNRLPYRIIKEKDKISLKPSVGGLTTGMSSIYKDYGGKWIGWTGQACDKVDAEDQKYTDDLFEKEMCYPVHLSKREIRYFYDGFSNKTLWPLFHYFAQVADFSELDWQMYVSVNQKFADAALKVLEEGDILWIHDYQLMLVPQMIKEKLPNITIGFFLHIPFPSFEIFRMLPWRKEILNGILGADLIGFHIYDYQRHFFSCVRRLLGYDTSFNQIFVGDRVILVDTFPMGIDFNKYETAAIDFCKSGKHDFISNEQKRISKNRNDVKLILSIDRLDYTKGLILRLKAFNRFLTKYPSQVGKVSLIMLVVPSRKAVDSYKKLKRQIDELVGNINGKYGTLNYRPIIYFYRSLPFESLVELYSSCDVAFITPNRDGMNLVAKEFVACRTNDEGVIILSEMTGAAKEMGEAITINPFNQEMVADSIMEAISMPLEEQKIRMTVLRERIKKYNVFTWATDFVEKLNKVESLQIKYNSKKVTNRLITKFKNQIETSKKRVLFLDYDGTLKYFAKYPKDAVPNEKVYNLLSHLYQDKKNDIVLISGRDKDTLEEWFGELPISLVAEHGVWYRPLNNEWKKIAMVTNEWMTFVRPIMESFVIRTPGSFIETKNYSLVWHYRNAELEQSELRVNELKEALSSLIANHNLEMMEGNKVIEVKNGGVNKGTTAMFVMANKKYDSIMAIGDDWTDEYMFRMLPTEAITVKRGSSLTAAKYRVDNIDDVYDMLMKIY
ncbi:MAG: bifunctional alpha,alpha-trehalose-phosphate synthase (UDP-forming)/trehalose-phosphatase [Bacteroidales bacterium]